MLGQEALLTEEAVEVGFLSAFVGIELVTGFEGVFAFSADGKRVLLRKGERDVVLGELIFKPRKKERKKERTKERKKEEKIE